MRQRDYEGGAAVGARGGVDDLIQLAHLHEPAILDVLVRLSSRHCRWLGGKIRCGLTHAGRRGGHFKRSG